MFAGSLFMCMFIAYSQIRFVSPRNDCIGGNDTSDVISHVSLASIGWAIVQVTLSNRN